MPVAVKGMPQVIDAPSSYLALAQLVANLLTDDPFKLEGNSLERYVAELPHTKMVAENESILTMRNEGGYVVKTQNDDWLDELP